MPAAERCKERQSAQTSDMDQALLTMIPCMHCQAQHMVWPSRTQACSLESSRFRGRWTEGGGTPHGGHPSKSHSSSTPRCGSDPKCRLEPPVAMHGWGRLSKGQLGWTHIWGCQDLSALHVRNRKGQIGLERTCSQFLTDTICPQAITLQHLVFWQLILGAVLELFLDAVIFTGDLSDFRTVILGDMGLWENQFLAP